MSIDLNALTDDQICNRFVGYDNLRKLATRNMRLPAATLTMNLAADAIDEMASRPPPAPMKNLPRSRRQFAKTGRNA